VNWPPTRPDTQPEARTPPLPDGNSDSCGVFWIAALKPAESEPEAGVEDESQAEIYGIASHDLYHAGQIQVLKRLIA